MNIINILKMIPFKLTDTASSIIEAASPATLEELLKKLKWAFSRVWDLHDLEQEMKNTSKKNASVIQYVVRTREISRKTIDRLRETIIVWIKNCTLIQVTAKAQRSYV